MSSDDVYLLVECAVGTHDAFDSRGERDISKFEKVVDSVDCKSAESRHYLRSVDESKTFFSLERDGFYLFSFENSSSFDHFAVVGHYETFSAENDSKVSQRSEVAACTDTSL